MFLNFICCLKRAVVVVPTVRTVTWLLIFLFQGVDTVDYNLLPSEDFKRDWIRHYLQTKAELQGKSKDSVTDKDVEYMRVLANKFSLVSWFTTSKVLKICRYIRVNATKYCRT